MELARILLKLLYLTVLYVVTYLIVKPQVQLNAMSLNMVVLGFSVLIMYFTFDYVYNFLMSNEIIFKNKKGDEEDDSEDEEIIEDKIDVTNIAVPENGSQTIVENKVHVDNKASSEYMLDHTHKFVENKVFDK